MTSLRSQHPLLMSDHPSSYLSWRVSQAGRGHILTERGWKCSSRGWLGDNYQDILNYNGLIMPGNDAISVDTLEIEMSSVLIIHCSVQMLRSPPAALTTTIQTSGHGGQLGLVSEFCDGSLIGRDWVWLMLRFMLVLVDIVSEYYLTRGQLSVAPGAGIMTQGDIHWATQLYRVTSVERTMSRPQYTSCVIN